METMLAERSVVELELLLKTRMSCVLAFEADEESAAALNDVTEQLVTALAFRRAVVMQYEEEARRFK